MCYRIYNLAEDTLMLAIATQRRCLKEREFNAGYHHRDTPRKGNWVTRCCFLAHFCFGEQWTATCLELGTSTFGDTLDEAKKELQEAVILQLDEVERLGFIADYLEENPVPIIRLADAVAPSDSSFALSSA